MLGIQAIHEKHLLTVPTTAVVGSDVVAPCMGSYLSYTLICPAALGPLQTQ